MGESYSAVMSERIKRPAGRPTQYDPAFCHQITAFFERAFSEEYGGPLREVKERTTNLTEFAQNPETKALEPGSRSLKEEVRTICAELPTIEAFARTIGVSHQSILNWAKLYPSFNEALQMAKDIQFHLITQRMLSGRYNVHAAIFVAKNVTWMRDRTEIGVEPVMPVPPPELRGVPTEVLDETRAMLLAAKQRLLEAARSD
jgi:hypothetical protein